MIDVRAGLEKMRYVGIRLSKRQLKKSLRESQMNHVIDKAGRKKQLSVAERIFSTLVGRLLKREIHRAYQVWQQASTEALRSESSLMISYRLYSHTGSLFVLRAVLRSIWHKESQRISRKLFQRYLMHRTRVEQLKRVYHCISNRSLTNTVYFWSLNCKHTIKRHVFYKVIFRALHRACHASTVDGLAHWRLNRIRARLSRSVLMIATARLRYYSMGKVQRMRLFEVRCLQRWLHNMEAQP